MVKAEHSCSQEKVITELKTNGTWMMEKINKIEAKVDRVHDDVSEIKTILTKGDGKISVLNKKVFGSETQKGITEKVEELETYINQIKGIISFMKGVVIISGINGMAILYLIWQSFQ